jgi:hypothetical protein
MNHQLVDTLRVKWVQMVDEIVMQRASVSEVRQNPKYPHKIFAQSVKIDLKSLESARYARFGLKLIT